MKEVDKPQNKALGEIIVSKEFMRRFSKNDPEAEKVMAEFIKVHRQSYDRPKQSK
jgi:hypothetical protein